jgi:hypothetical protein
MRAIVFAVSNYILFDISLHVSVRVLLALTFSVSNQDPVSFFVSVTISCSKLLSLTIKIWCAMPISSAISKQITSHKLQRKSFQESHALQSHCHSNDISVLNSKCFVFGVSNSLSMPATQLLC